MRRFARLLDDLYFARATSDKQRLLVDYLRTVPDPDRGYALGALTGDLRLSAIKAAGLRGLLYDRLDPVLVDLSYDYVGDLSETVSLLWPGPDLGGGERERALAADGSGEEDGAAPLPGLAQIVDQLQAASRTEAPAQVAALLDRMTARERWALLKLATGGLRVGMTARAAKRALAAFGNRDITEIEGVWHRVRLPFTALFAWLEGQGPEPEAPQTPIFAPVMLAHPLEAADLEKLDPALYAAEWKWDGVRVQLCATAQGVALFTRTGEDISAAFPEVVDRAGSLRAVLDGELLVTHGTETKADGSPRIASFNHLQQRLNRKTAPKTLVAQTPALIRAYDLLSWQGEDLRHAPYQTRRRWLISLLEACPTAAIDLSPRVPFADLEALNTLRRSCSAAVEDHREGLMLKRLDSPYVAGRPKGLWWKWKRDPLSLDCVMLYAQRGHGKRSSYYSDFTFGVWTAQGALVPVGKAYSGFTDEELIQLDKWVRAHTVGRFGPVREVEKALVLEIVCDSLHPSPRHKSGVAMRFPRIARIRWDKSAAEADHLDTVLSLMGVA